MNYVDDINKLTGDTKASSGFTRHPEGQYQGVITKITQKTINERPVWELKITTNAGAASYSIWGFSEADLKKSEIDSNFRDRVIKSIGRTKQLFVDVGLAEPKLWSVGEDSVLSMIPLLKGRNCTAVVQKRTDDPNKTITFINAPQTEGAQAATSQPPSANDAPNAGSVPTLDSIPF
jgi:hypothetical protein